MPRPPASDPEVRRLQREVDALRGAVHELRVLNEISREIGMLADLDEVLRRIVHRSVDALKAEEGVITLIDEAQKDGAQTLVRSMATELHRTPYHVNEPLIGWMQLYRSPLRLEHAATDRRFNQLASEDGPEALLSVPLLARSRLVGVLTVFNRRGGGSFGDADQRLLSIIGSQSAQIIENARLYQEEQALKTIQDELRVAFQIQTRLLPEAPPVVEGYDIAASSLPAAAVGGDFFDYIPIAENRLAVCVGDVSGKGLPAALMMATAQATIRGQAIADLAPAEILARVNRHLRRSLQRGTFLTLFYGELDRERHALHYVNAGHNRPILRRSDGEMVVLRDGGIALGLAPDATYAEGSVELRQGDLLLVYSDGLTEAMNEHREEFGEDRLRKILDRIRGDSAAAVVDAVLGGVAAHTGDAEASDDTTALVIVRR